MANVYSTQFFTSHSGALAVYAVPDGKVAVVRCVTVFNADEAFQGTGHLIYANNDVTFYQVTISPTAPATLYRVTIDMMHVVFNPHDEFYCQNSDQIDMTVSGYLLTLP